MPAAQDEDLPRMLSNRYRLEATIGHGGMGVVYRGLDLTMQRPIAVKLIRSVDGMELDDEIAGRFLREAKNTAKLQHEHIIDVFDLGRDPSGMYFVMELLEGESLSARIRREGKLAPERVVHIGRQMCEALEVAHRAGIIHRDLKPANIMLCSRAGDDDFVKVLDFGVAKSYAGDDQTQLTHTGMLVGTVDYMAPEQIMGKLVDGRTDVYSLGVMLYKMLCGKAPFRDGGVPALIHAHLNTMPKPLHEMTDGIPTELAHIVLRCLMKNPERRFDSMAELGRALVSTLPSPSMIPDAIPQTPTRMVDLEYRVPGQDQLFDETTTGARGGHSEPSMTPTRHAPVSRRPIPPRRAPPSGGERGFSDDDPPPDDATISDDPTMQFDRLLPRRLTAEELGLPPQPSGLHAHEGSRPLPLPPRRSVVPAGMPSPFGPPVLYPEDISTQKRMVPTEITRLDRTEGKHCAMCGVRNAPHAVTCAACGVSLGTDEQAAVRQRVSAPPTRPVTLPPNSTSTAGMVRAPVTLPPSSNPTGPMVPPRANTIPPVPVPPAPSSSRRNMNAPAGLPSDRSGFAPAPSLGSMPPGQSQGPPPPMSTPRGMQQQGYADPNYADPSYSDPSRPVYTDPSRAPYSQPKWLPQRPPEPPPPPETSTWKKFLRWTGLKNDR